MALRTPLRAHFAPDEEPQKKRGRLLTRSTARGQRGRYNITRIINARKKHQAYYDDWFHTIVNTKFYRIAGAVFSVYMLLYLLFAALYILAAEQDRCFTELWDDHGAGSVATPLWRRFLRATFFSVETMMSIGYGVDEWKTIADCPLLLLLIALQSLVGLLTSSILFGIVVTRVSRADQRATSIVFSKSAIVRVGPNNQLYLVLRVVEMRKHQLAHATVSVHAIADSGELIGDRATAAEEGSSVHALPMKLVHPTDEMMLVTPCFIVHKLDSHSPLLPPAAAAALADDEDDDRNIELPQLLRALQSQPSMTLAGGTGASPAINDSGGSRSSSRRPSSERGTPTDVAAMAARMAQVRQHMLSVNAEVLVLLEGIDTTTSKAAQARVSYTVDDIGWDAAFVPCARRQPDGGVRIDFDKMHAVVSLGQCSASAGSTTNAAQ